jgi:glycerol transport system ATP-binding protein
VEALTFADRVVVFYDGYVVQLGEPHELFETPEHTFVGYFIGSPGMNVIPCTLDGYTAVAAGQARVPLPSGIPEKACAMGGKLELGVRPEFLKLTAEPTDGAVNVTVTDRQDLGNYEVVTVRMGEQPVVVKLPEETHLSGEDLWLTLPPEWTRLYAGDWLVKTPEGATS